MSEVNRRGSEIFPMSETVRGGKHHRKIGLGSALLAPALAVSAAALITLAVLESGTEEYPTGYLPGPPIQEVRQPEDPPDEEPQDPEPEPEEEPTTPPPTTPPPTTPPPTTPPPTTPPPTTPPPTTPPPTTPPPYIPPDDPVTPRPKPDDPEPIENEPSVDGFEWNFEMVRENGIPKAMVMYGFYVEKGDASLVQVRVKGVMRAYGESNSALHSFSDDGSFGYVLEISPVDDEYFALSVCDLTIEVRYQYKGKWSQYSTVFSDSKPFSSH